MSNRKEKKKGTKNSLRNNLSLYIMIFHKTLCVVVCLVSNVDFVDISFLFKTLKWSNNFSLSSFFLKVLFFSLSLFNHHHHSKTFISKHYYFPYDISSSSPLQFLFPTFFSSRSPRNSNKSSKSSSPRLNQHHRSNFIQSWRRWMYFLDKSSQTELIK